MSRRLVAACLAIAIAAPAVAQVRVPGASTVSQESRTIGEDSRTIGEDSGPVGEGALTIGEASLGPVRSGPVSDMNTRSMLSGPVSSMSRGPVSAGRSMTGGGSITEASAGAVKHDVDAPLGTRISAPLRELAPLQEQLKRLRAEGDAAAIEAAAAPVSLPIATDEVAPLDEAPVAPFHEAEVAPFAEADAAPPATE